MIKTYCTACNKEAVAFIVQKDEKYKVRGEDIKVSSSLLECACGAEIFDEKLDEANLVSAYNKYRQKHDLLLPQEIKDVREKYGLSQRSLAKLLSWGEVTINRYESGEIQDAVHNEVLLFILEPQNMKKLFDRNKNSLTVRTREKLEEKLNNLLNQDLEEKLYVKFSEYIQSKTEIDEFSGFKKFDMDKIQNMILFLVKSKDGVYKTAINKLVWYMDFLNFKESAVSISGCHYYHLPHGPIPDAYEVLLSLMINKTLRREEMIIAEDIVGEKFYALTEPDLSLFSKEELQVMEFVVRKFKNFTTKQLRDYSHKEKAYIETQENQIMSYRLAESLTLSTLVSD